MYHTAPEIELEGWNVTIDIVREIIKYLAIGMYHYLSTLVGRYFL